MLTRTLRLFFALLGVAVFSQEPEFLQQYAQRVGGALGEIERALAEQTGSAQRNGLTLDQSIDRLKASPDSSTADQGRMLERQRDRARTLRTHYESVVHGSAWDRLTLFPFRLDLPLAADTLAIYAPAVPLTPEGFIASALGFILGWLFGLVFLRLPVKLLHRRPVARQSA